MELMGGILICVGVFLAGVILGVVADKIVESRNRKKP